MNCLYKMEELPADNSQPPDAVVAKGLTMNLGFHPKRIAEHKEAIAAMCNELPLEFQKQGGGGWSFLNLCQTKTGEQWGEHHNCEQLLLLAIASGQGGFSFPRELWETFPGGMPYVYFDTRKPAQAEGASS